MKSRCNLAFIAIGLAILGPANTARSYPTALPDVLVEKTADVDTVAPGDLITYTLFVCNCSLYHGNDVYLRDALPDGLTPVSWVDKDPDYYDPFVIVQFGPQKCVWYMKSISGWDRFWIELTVRVDPSYSLDKIENFATISISDPEVNYHDNESILITRVVHPTIPAPGAFMLVLTGAAFTTRLRKGRSV